jgi:hypothetical protein
MNPDAPVTSTGPRSVDETGMLSPHPLRRAEIRAQCSRRRYRRHRRGLADG